MCQRKYCGLCEINDERSRHFVKMSQHELKQMVEKALYHFDRGSSSNNKYKLVEVLSATKEVAKGIVYKLHLKIGETDCLKEHFYSRSCELLYPDGSKYLKCNFLYYLLPPSYNYNVITYCETADGEHYEVDEELSIWNGYVSYGEPFRNAWS